MRFSVQLLAFILVAASALPECASQKASPQFTEQEAREKIGERIRYIRGLDDQPPAIVSRVASEIYSKTGEGLEYTNVIGVSICEKTGKGLNLKKGDVGTVVDIEKVTEGGYFLRVHWDLNEECEPNMSYMSKTVYRILVQKF